jgi:hypothetical protein
MCFEILLINPAVFLFFNIRILMMGGIFEFMEKSFLGITFFVYVCMLKTKCDPYESHNTK